jgi:hypothetical protein
MSAVINVTKEVFCGDICMRCGAHMQATHHWLCQYPDGTPTGLTDQEVRGRLGLRVADIAKGSAFPRRCFHSNDVGGSV